MITEKTIRIEYYDYFPEPFMAQELVYSAAELVRKHISDFDITTIQDNDEKAFDLLCNGDTSSILWFNNPEKKAALRRLSPRDFNDFLAFNTLYELTMSGFHQTPDSRSILEQFVEWRWHPESITSIDPSIDEILKPTCGVFVFYEQITQAIRIVAGYDSDHSDALRKFMCKEKKKELAVELETFVSGAIGNGYSREKAETVFDFLHRHVKHCMKRVYAAATAMIIYRSAYLKAHFPEEFAAALKSRT